MPKKKSITNFNVGKLPNLVNSLSNLIADSTPKSLYGILSSAEETPMGLLVNKRWLLVPNDKADYDIVDTYSDEIVYKSLARLQTAISIISLLIKNRDSNLIKLKMLQSTDQAYFRCLSDIHFYKLKIKQDIDIDKKTTIQYRLDDKLYRLAEIKQQLFKLYC
jgi:hypothetical protein